MSSIPLPCPCCPRCRASANAQANVAHVPSKPTVTPRRSKRIQEKAWRDFYNSCLDIIASYEHIYESGDIKLYESTVIKRLLDMTTTPDKEMRKILVRVIFEFLAQNTYIMDNYPRFRATVINKIDDITNDLYNEPYTINNQPIQDATDKLCLIIYDKQRMKV